MSPLAFLAKNLVSTLLLPPLLPFALIAIGLLLARRFRRGGEILAWLGLISGLLLCLPTSVTLIAHPLESAPVISSKDLAQAQAIVILAGGRRSRAPEFGGETVSPLTLERIRYGAHLARETHLPLLVTGGAPSKGTPEAELMRRTLVEDFGITPRWVETRSLDTRENATFSAALLGSAGIRRVALVTHALHMRRSVNEFRYAGLNVYPAPTGHATGRAGGEEAALPALPSMSSAYTGWYALHEWLGLLAQKIAGRG